MRTKSKHPKIGICIRLREETIRKVDQIAEEKLMERSEFVRRIIENYLITHETGL